MKQRDVADALRRLSQDALAPSAADPARVEADGAKIAKALNDFYRLVAVVRDLRDQTSASPS